MGLATTLDNLNSIPRALNVKGISAKTAADRIWHLDNHIHLHYENEINNKSKKKSKLSDASEYPSGAKILPFFSDFHFTLVVVWC